MIDNTKKNKTKRFMSVQMIDHQEIQELKFCRPTRGPKPQHIRREKREKEGDLPTG